MVIGALPKGMELWRQSFRLEHSLGTQAIIYIVGGDGRDAHYVDRECRVLVDWGMT